jgi:ferritin-like metal-binding protein YciE
MFEKLENEREFLTYKLGSALTMEQKVLDMLDDLEGKAHRPQLKQQLSHHADETRQQISNINEAFAALGAEPDDKPNPVVSALDKEARVEMRKAEDDLDDAVILAGAAETEHHEIATYETLITHAEAMGQPRVVELLQMNLEQERHTLQEVQRATQELARELVAA